MGAAGCRVLDAVRCTPVAGQVLAENRSIGGPMIDFSLRAFLAVAKTNSFTRAAALLNLSQPAVTHQIKKMEELFHARLFDRLQNKIKLTPAGEILLRFAEQIDQLYQGAEREILELNTRVAGDIHIGVATLLGNYLLPRVVGKFKRAFPETHIFMLVGNSKEMLGCLREGVIDLAIVSEPISPPHFVAVPLYRDHLSVIVYPSHPWWSLSELDPAQLYASDFISREIGSGTREVYTRALEPFAEGRALRSSIVLGNTEAAKMGVIGEIGFAIISRLACQPEIELGLLREVPVKGLEMRRDFFLVSNPEKTLRLPATKLKEFLRKWFSEERP
jgi:DNA-binding transcriptional LysR family regulator